MPKTLNARQIRFCELMAMGASQTEAYLQAGYKSTRDAARKHAARMMTNGDILKKIKVLRAPIVRGGLLSRDEKRRILAQIATNEDEKAMVRIKAMELDSKLAGHYEPDRIEIEPGPSTLISIRERAKQMTSAMTAAYEKEKASKKNGGN